MIVKLIVQVHEIGADAVLAERMVREALAYYPYNQLGHGHRVTVVAAVDHELPTDVT